MTEPADLALIFKKLSDLELSQSTLVAQNRVLSEHLLNEVPIKRKKRLEEEASVPVLSKKQLEWQENYQKQNLDLREKNKRDLGEFSVGGQWRYFSPQNLVEFPWLIFDISKGNLGCQICLMGSKPWNTNYSAFTNFGPTQFCYF